jgi:hypothetical protein
VLIVTSLALSTRRLFEHIASLPRRSLASRLGAAFASAKVSAHRELAALRPVTRLLIVGLISWIGLVTLTTLIAVVSLEISTMKLPAWFDSHISGSPGTEHRLDPGFENIIQRPLFSRSRQTASAMVIAPPSQQPPAMLDQNFTLKGVYINGATAKAFMTSAQNPLGVWVQPNEEIAGWRVVAVTPDQVALDAQNDKLVVQLSVNGRPK